MTERIAWLLEVSINPGHSADFYDLMKEMVASTEAESGTVGYQWSIGGDDTTVHILEQFSDSSAVLAHLQGFGTYAGRFLEVLSVVGLTVYGDPSSEVRDRIAAFSPVYLKPAGGFVHGATEQVLPNVASAASGG